MPQKSPKARRVAVKAFGSSIQSTLLTVAGKTPATVTEALWGLAVGRGIRIDRLIVLTTADAAELLRTALPKAIKAISADYPAPLKSLKFEVKDDLRICPGPDGKRLSDIRNEAENEAVADWIMRQTAELCADPGKCVHASLAGGRKTMAFFLGAAMQLFGRTEDRLYHVLVPEAYEIPGFDYPPPRPKLIERRKGEPVDASRAKVDMAEIPFVRLGGLFERSELNELAGKLSFSALVRRADSAMRGPRFEVHVYWQQTLQHPRPRILLVDPDGGEEIDLKFFQKIDTVEFLMLSYLLSERRRDANLGHRDPRRIPIFRIDDLPETIDLLLYWLTRRLGRGNSFFDAADSALAKSLIGYQRRLREIATSGSKPKSEPDIPETIRDEWYKGDLGARISRLNKEIRRAIESGDPTESPDHYTIQGLGHDVPHAEKGYWYIGLPPEKIRFLPDEP